MAGGTPEHAALAATVIGLLFPQLRDGRCRAHDAEVLSRSTEEHDRGDKFEHYKHIPSLREYVLVSHRERSVEVSGSNVHVGTRGTSQRGTREQARGRAVQLGSTR
jgi:hypothetical protein